MPVLRYLKALKNHEISRFKKVKSVRVLFKPVFLTSFSWLKKKCYFSDRKLKLMIHYHDLCIKFEFFFPTEITDLCQSIPILLPSNSHDSRWTFVRATWGAASSLVLNWCSLVPSERNPWSQHHHKSQSLDFSAILCHPSKDHIALRIQISALYQNLLVFPRLSYSSLGGNECAGSHQSLLKLVCPILEEVNVARAKTETSENEQEVVSTRLRRSHFLWKWRHSNHGDLN